MPIIPFIGEAYAERSLVLDSQVCENLYPEIAGKDSKNFAGLYGTPGLNLKTTVSGGAVRGLFSSAKGRLFAVVGNQFVEISLAVDGTTHLQTVWGTLSSAATDTNMVTMAENTSEIFIADNRYFGRLFNQDTNAFTTVSDANYPLGSKVVFLNGRFIVNEPSTGKFYWSDLEDGSSWDGANFATAEGSPDGLQTLVVNNNELCLIGDRSIEVWYNTDAGGFSKIPGTLRDKGTITGDTAVHSNDQVLWLGSDSEGHAVVWAMDGYTPRRISTPPIEYELNGYSTLSDARAFVYQIPGHIFYVLTFPTGNKTWAYDLITGMWHQWGYLNDVNGQNVRHRGIAQAFWNNKNYIGDWENGKIYTLELDKYTDNGQEIKRVRSSPHIHSDRKRISFSSFELDMETGVGVTTGQGSDPIINLEISNDGGRSFGNLLPLEFGKIGERFTRARWRRLGRSRDRVFRVSTSEPVKIAMVGAHVNTR